MIGSKTDRGVDRGIDFGVDTGVDFGVIKNVLYQLVTARLDGARIGQAGYFEWASALVEKGIGGFIVFGGEMEVVRGFVEALQGAARVPLFIMSDVERGVGWQLAGATELPCQMALCAALSPDALSDAPSDALLNASPHDLPDAFSDTLLNAPTNALPDSSAARDGLALLEAALSALSAECLHAGINMPLVPVLDVNSNPLNPIVCTRAFSDRPEVVARFGVRYVRALNGAGLVSCVKHFPGHGDTQTDSHIGLPVIARTRDALGREDLPPFAEAIEAGAPAVMVAHIAVPALDSVPVEGKVPPATLSHEITTGLLRGRMGFGGLVVTDALNMGALKEFRHAPAACLKAGADVLLHPEDSDECVEGLVAALDEKFLDRADVERAYKNIIRAKEIFSRCGMSGGSAGIYSGRDDLDFKAHAALSLDLHRRSITLVKGALLEGAVVKGVSVKGVSVEGASVEGVSVEGAVVEGVLAAFNPESALLVLCGDYAPEKPRRGIDLTPLKDAFGSVVELRDYYKKPLRGNRPVVFAVFTSVSAWRGTSGLDDEEAGRLKSAIAGAGERTCIVSFGSPYVLAAFGGANVLVAAYEPSVGAQRAVVGCLRGEAAARGRLPVDIRYRDGS
jgi:beta-glucosidase-like glycosyl hydrolase